MCGCGSVMTGRPEALTAIVVLVAVDRVFNKEKEIEGMEILKRNEEKAPEIWERRCECGKCLSLLKVEEADLTRFHGNDRNGVWDYVCFQCGACDAWNSFPDGTVPKIVRHRIKDDKFPSVPGGFDCECRMITVRSG